MHTRPRPEDLVAAEGRSIPDVLAPGLRVVFCGINPGLWSGATGQHFARPGNRFWPALHRAGFTERRLRPDQQCELLDHGLGITNLVDRASARADALGSDELRAGGRELEAKMHRLRPAWLAVVGITAYRTAFGRRGAVVGPQEHHIGATRVWVLPNPSGLNAHWPLPALSKEFARLRRAAEEHS